jgi:hypothetical protein
MLWSDDVLDKNSREMERLWLAGTIAAGLCADGLRGEHVAQQAVKVADMVLEELAKGGTK